MDKLYLGVPWCAGGWVSVPEIRFNDELDSIIIDFGWNITMDG